MDATKVRANASINSLVPRLAEVVDDHLVEIFGTEPPAEDPEKGGQRVDGGARLSCDDPTAPPDQCQIPGRTFCEQLP